MASNSHYGARTSGRFSLRQREAQEIARKRSGCWTMKGDKSRAPGQNENCCRMAELLRELPDRNQGSAALRLASLFSATGSKAGKVGPSDPKRHESVPYLADRRPAILILVERGCVEDQPPRVKTRNSPHLCGHAAAGRDDTAALRVKMRRAILHPHGQ